MKRTLWIAAAVVAADQATKALARQLTGPVTLIPGVLGLRLTENSGAAFSMLAGVPWLPAVLSVVILAAMALVLRRYRLGRAAAVGAALILGGALGNLIDRVAAGRVTDMVEILAFRFAVFNAADVAVVAGCALTAWSVLFRPKEWERRDG